MLSITRRRDTSSISDRARSIGVKKVWSGAYTLLTRRTERGLSRSRRGAEGCSSVQPIGLPSRSFRESQDFFILSSADIHFDLIHILSRSFLPSSLVIPCAQMKQATCFSSLFYSINGSLPFSKKLSGVTVGLGSVFCSRCVRRRLLATDVMFVHSR